MPEQNGEPEGQFVYRLPDGRSERPRLPVADQLNVSLLRPGDVVTFQMTADESGPEYLYRVTRTDWLGASLGIGSGFSPTPVVYGRLFGAELPQDIQGKDVSLNGSGFGGSVMMPGILAKGCSPYFHQDRGSEFMAPDAAGFRVLRGEAGSYRGLDTAGLQKEAEVASQRHARRLELYQRLMQKFGFNYDFRNAQKTTHNFQQVALGEPLPKQEEIGYHDRRLAAQYDGGMAMGNFLAIIDQKTHRWIGLKYYNFHGEDVLQIGVADLPRGKVFTLPDYIASTSDVYRSGTAMTTFTTSAGLGLEAIEYKPSDKEAAKYLRVPRLKSASMPIPSIQLFPDGKIFIPKDWAFSHLEYNHPGQWDQVTAAMEAGFSPDGLPSVVLGGHKISLKSPEEEIEKILRL